MQGFGNAASNRSDGVAVPANRDGVADSVFVAGALQGADDGLGHRACCAFGSFVGGADGVGSGAQVVAKAFGQAAGDGLWGGFMTCPEDGQGHGTGRGDAVGMVVGDGRGGVRPSDRFFFAAGQQTHGADAHGRAVAPTAVGLRVVVHEPFGKAFAPAAVFGVEGAPLDQGGLWVGASGQGVCHCHGADRVIGEAGFWVEQRFKVLAAKVLEFVGCADDVADDGAEHAGTFKCPGENLWLGGVWGGPPAQVQPMPVPTQKPTVHT